MIKYIFLLCTVLFNQNLFSMQTNTKIMQIQNVYQTHLPPKIYECLIANKLLNPSQNKTETEKQHNNSLDYICVYIEPPHADCDPQKYSHMNCQEPMVTINFFVGIRNQEDNFGGVSLCYQNNQLIGWAFFDAEGRDYVMTDPPTQEEKSRCKIFILLLLEGGVERLKELPETKPP